MSGCEIIGVVAAALQLVAYTVQLGESILDLPGHLKHLSDRLGQLKALRAILEKILQDKSCHTPFFITQVKAITEKVEALSNLLRQITSKLKRPFIKKFAFAFSLRRLERLINERFDSLESDKSNWALSIMSSCRRALTDVTIASEDNNTSRKCPLGMGGKCMKPSTTHRRRLLLTSEIAPVEEFFDCPSPTSMMGESDASSSVFGGSPVTHEQSVVVYKTALPAPSTATMCLPGSQNNNNHNNNFHPQVFQPIFLSARFSTWVC